jgi:hypothetical protein
LATPQVLYENEEIEVLEIVENAANAGVNWSRHESSSTGGFLPSF